jgi:hypothetical protein
MQDSDPKQPQPTAAAESDDYGVVETLGLRTPDIVDQERVRRRLAQESQYTVRGRRLVFLSKRPSLPRLPMLLGVFTFPWQRGERARWLCFSVAAMVPLGYAIGAFAYGRAPAEGFVTVGSWIMSAVFVASGCVSAAAWAAVAFSYGVAIVRDTAEGSRRVESWPDGPFIDWIGDCLYVVNALALSALPALAFLVPGWPHGPGTLLIVTMCLLLPFPVLLLSMFEADSSLVPISPAVWRSMIDAWWAWGAFYIETAVLCVAVGWFLRESVLALRWLALVPDAFLLVAAMMIYFRLLGRLGHCCADAARRRDPDEAEEFDDR